MCVLKKLVRIVENKNTKYGKWKDRIKQIKIESKLNVYLMKNLKWIKERERINSKIKINNGN